jgi:hypothetical protein
MNIICRRLLCRGSDIELYSYIFQQFQSEIVAKYDIIVSRVCSVNCTTVHVRRMHIC